MSHHLFLHNPPSVRNMHLDFSNIRLQTVFPHLPLPQGVALGYRYAVPPGLNRPPSSVFRSPCSILHLHICILANSRLLPRIVKTQLSYRIFVPSFSRFPFSLLLSLCPSPFALCSLLSALCPLLFALCPKKKTAPVFPGRPLILDFNCPLSV
jgi:hypothetical protein